MFKKVLCIIGLSMFLISSFGFCNSKIKTDNYTIRFEQEIQESQFDANVLKQPNVLHAYILEASEKEIQFEPRLGCSAAIYRAVLENGDFKYIGSANVKSHSTQVGPDKWVSRKERNRVIFNTNGTYLIEIRNYKDMSIIERVVVYVGGVDKALLADENATENPATQNVLTFNNNPEHINELLHSYYGKTKFSIFSEGNTTVVNGICEEDGIKYLNLGINARGDTKRLIKLDSQKVQSDGSYEFNFINELEDGRYELDILAGTALNGTYGMFLSDFEFVVENGLVYFEQSQVYEHNKNMHSQDNDSTATLSYLANTENPEKDNSALSDLSLQITQGKASNYDKVLAIHDWVAENIYYDLDSVIFGKEACVDPLDVLETKTGACAGYAGLATELLRHAGIPARMVRGYAFGISTTDDYWTPTNMNLSSNHIWTEAYVDGRWVIFDATWSSSNSFQGDNFTKKEQKGQYFDMTLEFLSRHHKIIEYVK
jgi:hypothetical protein